MCARMSRQGILLSEFLSTHRTFVVFLPWANKLQCRVSTLLNEAVQFGVLCLILFKLSKDTFILFKATK